MLTLLRSQLSQGKNRRVDSSRELTQKIVDKLHTTKSFLHHLLTNILRRINFWQQNLMSQSHMKSPPVPSEEVRFRTVKSRLMLGEVPLLLPIVGYCRTYQLPPCLLLPTITATIVGFYFYFCRLLLTAIIGYYCKSHYSRLLTTEGRPNSPKRMIFLKKIKGEGGYWLIKNLYSKHPFVLRLHECRRFASKTAMFFSKIRGGAKGHLNPLQKFIWVSHNVLLLLLKAAMVGIYYVPQQHHFLECNLLFASCICLNWHQFHFPS